MPACTESTYGELEALLVVEMDLPVGVQHNSGCILQTTEQRSSIRRKG